MKTKKTRYIPEGFKEYKPEIGDYSKDLFACYVNLDQPHNPKAIFFTGKQSNSTWYYSFPNIEQMKNRINETISSLMSWEDMKAKRRAEKAKELQNVKVGDLFCSSWGYDQTNVDFYQCTEVKGKTFTIREIAGKTVPNSTYSHGMADERVAVRDAFLDEEKYPPMKKRSFKLNSYAWLSPTTETQKHYCSWYA